jgi:hypothetical protein
MMCHLLLALRGTRVEDTLFQVQRTKSAVQPPTGLTIFQRR